MVEEQNEREKDRFYSVVRVKEVFELRANAPRFPG